MDSSGSSGPKKESSVNEEVTPAQEFMNSDEVGKKAKLSNIANVMEIESILPKKLSSWDKGTTTMVLEKALSLCGISTGNKVKTPDEAQKEQEALELQIKVLQEKMERNAALLEEHRKAREAIEIGRAGQVLIRHVFAVRQQQLEVDRRHLGEDHPDVLNAQMLLNNGLNAVQAAQEQLDLLELDLPLRD